MRAKEEKQTKSSVRMTAEEQRIEGARLLTHPVLRLESHRELFEKLTGAEGAIKLFREVADFPE